MERLFSPKTLAMLLTISIMTLWNVTAVYADQYKNGIVTVQTAIHIDYIYATQHYPMNVPSFVITENNIGSLEKGKEVRICVSNYLAIIGCELEVAESNAKISELKFVGVDERRSIVEKVNKDTSYMSFTILEPSTDKPMKLNFDSMVIAHTDEFREQDYIENPIEMYVYGDAVNEGITLPYIKFTLDSRHIDTFPKKVTLKTGDDYCTVGGEKVSVGAKSYISESGLLMAPLPYIALATGIPDRYIGWNSEDGIITLHNSGFIEFHTDEKDMSTRGYLFADKYPGVEIREGMPFIPVRLLSSVLDVPVRWDKQTMTATFDAVE